MNEFEIAEAHYYSISNELRMTFPNYFLIISD